MVPPARRMLVGRDRELAELRGALEDAQAGRGGLFLIAGEPGVGKTRLVEELADDFRARELPVLWGRCMQGGGQTSFAPWIDHARDMLAWRGPSDALERVASFAEYLVPLRWMLRTEVPDPPRTEEDRLRFFDAMAELTKRFGLPALAVFDDLHWADMPSLRLLEHLVPHLNRSHALYIATYRDVEVRGTETGRIIASIARWGRHIHLRGLARDEIAQLIRGGFQLDAGDDVVDAVFDATEGNPYFVDEVVRLLSAEHRAAPMSGATIRVPETVAETIRRRLEVLVPEDRALLEDAAVAGRTFSRALLERLGHSPEDALDCVGRAMELGIVSEAPSSSRSFSFAHALMRETLYADIPPAARVRGHRRVGDALAELAGDDPGDRLAEIASHFIEAAVLGDAAHAITYAIRAARHAMDSAGYEDALTFYRRALELLDASSGDVGQRLEALLGRAEAEHALRMYEVAVGTFDAAADLARELGRVRELARAAIGYSRAADDFARFDVLAGAVRLLSEALELLDDNREPALRAAVLSRLSRSLHYVAPPERTLGMAREAVAIAESIGDDHLLTDALRSLRYALFLPEHFDERLVVGERLLKTPAPRSAPDVIRASVCRDLLEGARLDDADELFRRFYRDGTWSTGATLAWFPAEYLTWRSVVDGRFEDARRHLGELRSFARDKGWANSAAVWLHFVLAWEVGEPEHVDQAVERLIRGAGLPDRYGYFLRVFVDAELGRTDAARRTFDRLAAKNFENVPRNLTIRWTVPVLACVAARLGDGERALLLRPMLETYGRRIVPLGLAPLHTVPHWLGVLSMALDDDDQVEAQFSDALELADRIGAPAWIARTRYERARWRVARGRDAQAESDALEALATADDLGMTRIAAGIRELFSDISPRETVGGEPPAVLRHAGEYWTIVWRSEVSRIRDSKGMRLLRELLAHPRREIHALELQGAAEGRDVKSGSGHTTAEDVSAEGGGAALLDPAAKEAYRRRVEDLRSEIEDAKAWGDPVREERAREELDAVAKELSRATGLGGRDRRTAGAAERARVAVTRAVRRQIEAISQHDADLGRHLAESVRTGTFCSYEPDPPVRWSL